MRRPSARPAGFTLIELLIAIALMAVFSVLGWRGLDSVLRTRERIVQTSDSLRALSVSFAQIQEDLRRAWPVRLLNLPVPAIGFVAQENEPTPALMLYRESQPASGPPQIQQVVYRLRGGVLERGFAPWMQALSMTGAQTDGSTAAAPAVLDAGTAQRMSWQPLVSGLQNFQMRAWVPGQGWIPAAGLLGQPTPSVSQTGQQADPNSNTMAQAIPAGLELVLDSVDGEHVVRLLTVRD